MREIINVGLNLEWMMTDPSYGYIVGDEVVLDHVNFLEERYDLCNWNPNYDLQI